jgi:tRNA pseudouridine32 synthase/23S rRNA pseudouridine746 synthase/23S rRNA pseudouridine1911/1915/1917 synthase
MIKKKTVTKHLPRGLIILYEDNDILVVDKPAGLLTIGTDTEKIKTAYHALSNYVRKGCAKSSKHVYVVHRLDRETSGVLVFAKTREAKDRLQEEWQETEKKYLAVVHGSLAAKSGTITSYLTESKAHVVYATHDAAKGKLAHTAYRVLKETSEFSLLEIGLLTGRKHQIRVHLADKGHPVVGDAKYGSKDSANRLALHAFSLAIKHPISGRPLRFESIFPGFLHKLIGGFEQE